MRLHTNLFVNKLDNVNIIKQESGLEMKKVPILQNPKEKYMHANDGWKNPGSSASQVIAILNRFILVMQLLLTA